MNPIRDFWIAWTVASFRQQPPRAAPPVDDDYPYREALHDLVQLRSEAFAIGGGPGFKEREAKAWRRAAELFEP